jgi:hypothetical protein
MAHRITILGLFKTPVNPPALGHRALRRARRQAERAALADARRAQKRADRG